MEKQYDESMIDTKALNLMRLRIIKLERDNDRDKKLTEAQMVKEICKIIEEEMQ